MSKEDMQDLVVGKLHRMVSYSYSYKGTVVMNVHPQYGYRDIDKGYIKSLVTTDLSKLLEDVRRVTDA